MAADIDQQFAQKIEAVTEQWAATQQAAFSATQAICEVHSEIASAAARCGQFYLDFARAQRVAIEAHADEATQEKIEADLVQWLQHPAIRPRVPPNFQFTIVEKG